MTAKIKPIAVSSFVVGMNTRRPDFKLKQSTAPFGTFMREIINCDISEEGPLKRRRGYTNVIGATAGGSLWSDDAQAYYADGGTMFSVSSSVVATSVAGASLNPGAPVSFVSAPMGGAYWTDGLTLGYVLNGVSIPVAPPNPTVVPVVTQGVGNLAAGIYSYAFTYVDSAGRESGATPTVAVTLLAGTSLIFALIGAPAYTMNVYISGPNGVVMHRRAQIITGGATTVNSLTSGPECTTVGLVNMPAGRFVRYNNGRLMVAVGSLLFFSKPFMPGLFDPTMDYIPFPTTITMVEAVSNQGVYVAADQTYWLEGDVAKTDLKAPLQFGAIMGSGITRPDIPGCFWMSTRGIVVGNDNGSVVELQAENVMINLSANGASLMMDRDGVVQLMTTMYGATLTPESEGSKYTSAEIADASSGGDTWIVNEAAKSSRRYTNYPFTSYCEIVGRYYGIKADGIYLLEGDTDAGAPIAAMVNPGRQDFKSPMRKRMEAAYMTVGSTGVRTGQFLTGSDTMHLTITDDQGNSHIYDTRVNDTEIKQQRIDVGRGINGVYLGFKITNEGGCSFELSGFELIAVETTRRLAG